MAHRAIPIIAFPRVRTICTCICVSVTCVAQVTETHIHVHIVRTRGKAIIGMALCIVYVVKEVASFRGGSVN